MGDAMDGVNPVHETPTQVQPLTDEQRERVKAAGLAAGIEQDNLHVLLKIADEVGVPLLQKVLGAAVAAL